MTGEDILAAATALAPLIAKTTTATGGAMPTGQFPNFAAQIVELAMEISKKRRSKTDRPKFHRIA
jgi:hypothetical protein